MSHQPYETWLLSEESLDEEQEKALQTHLEDCRQCQQLSQSWTQVQSLISTSSEPEPAPGFSLRWQQRLAIRREHQQQRKMWLLTLGLLALALIIFLSLAVITFSSHSFSYEISQTFASLARTVAKINHFLEMIQSVVQSFPLVLPLLVILGLGGFSASITLIITWLSSLIRFYQPVKEGVINQ
jgi:predicted anti-sigma-YlaC factor YlaD